MTTQEYLVSIAGVGLVGLAGLGGLGGAFGDAVSGDARGGAAFAARAGAGPRLAPAVSAEAGIASFIEDAAGVTRGLYGDVPAKLKAVSVDGNSVVNVKFALLLAPDAAEITREAVAARFKAAGLSSPNPESVALATDLLTEAKRLGAEGVIDLGPSAEGSLREVIARRVASALGGEANWFNDWSVRGAQQSVPPGLLSRLEGALRIHEAKGLPLDEVRAIFPSRGQDALELLLEPFEGPRMSAPEFLAEYRANPAGALERLPEDARGYLADEVLPVLRGELAENADLQAALLAAIVTGDAKRVAGALAEGSVPAQVEDLAKFAVTLFPDFGTSFGPLRRFSVEEAEALIRFPLEDAKALLAREEGGEPLRRLVAAFEGADLEARPGRPQRLRNRSIEEWLRAVARGDEVAAGDFAGATALLFREIPEDVRELVESVLRRFAREE